VAAGGFAAMTGTKYTLNIGEIFKPKLFNFGKPCKPCGTKTMAPNRGPPSKSGAGKSSSKTGGKGSGNSAGNGSSVKNRISKSKPKAPPPKQQKTKSAQVPQRKKRKIYTDKELGLPKLNMITPVGVEKPRGKKKGKIFVDDRVWIFWL
jgi:hypothetical protein